MDSTDLGNLDPMNVRGTSPEPRVFIRAHMNLVDLPSAGYNLSVRTNLLCIRTPGKTTCLNGSASTKLGVRRLR